MTALPTGRCWWRGHKWTTWTPLHVRIVDVAEPYDLTKQKRTCARCGLQKWRYMS